jgi:cobalamin biosynthesis protein CbiG
MNQSSIWIGIGCRRGISKAILQSAIAQILFDHHVDERLIAGIATIDRKSDEVGLLEYCQDQSLPLCCFSAQQLSAIAIPTPSDSVKKLIETPSVAEAAAMCAAKTHILKVPKQVILGVTLAIAHSPEDEPNN